jgi:hypothetical protein
MDTSTPLISGVYNNCALFHKQGGARAEVWFRKAFSGKCCAAKNGWAAFVLAIKNCGKTGEAKTSASLSANFLPEILAGEFSRFSNEHAQFERGASPDEMLFCASAIVGAQCIFIFSQQSCDAVCEVSRQAQSGAAKEDTASDSIRKMPVSTNFIRRSFIHSMLPIPPVRFK